MSVGKDTSIKSYSWFFASKPDNSNAILDNFQESSVTFIPDVIGKYKIGLVVSDGKVKSNPSYVELYVKDTIYLDIFVHAHPDDIQLFMGNAASKAIKNKHKVVMLLTTAGDGGNKNVYLTAKNNEKVTYPEGRFRAHNASIKYWMNTNENPILQDKMINTHIINHLSFGSQVYLYNLKLSDGYRGVGFKANNFEALSKLYSNKIPTISSIDGNIYSGKVDLEKTVIDILLPYIKNYQKIVFHIPEYNLNLNKGSHPDHIITGHMMHNILSNNNFGCVHVKLYNDYINGSQPINLTKEDEKSHRMVNKIVDDVLIENGRNENVRKIHLAFLGKEYISRSYTVNCY